MKQTTLTVQYFDIKKHWRRLRPYVESDEAQDILVRDFNMFTFGRWKRQFKKGMFPADFESCDWGEHHRGPRPEYWQYTKHAACHWLVNFNLCVAQLALPYKKWRILTSEKHSTVWDGIRLLFDFNLQAMGIPAEESFDLANGEELRPGQHLEVDFATHWRDDLRGADSFRILVRRPEGSPRRSLSGGVMHWLKTARPNGTEKPIYWPMRMLPLRPPS